MPYMTYTDANGIGHDSYEDACIYYGCDTPAQIEAEMLERWAEESILWQDDVETSGPKAEVPMEIPF